MKEVGMSKIITYYNATKSGVDVVDHMKTEYCVSRISQTCSMTVFNGMLYIEAMNAYIIFKETPISKESF